ncbi:MAG: SDR family NAD(P)-dependent oxidoreductase [Salinisphaeraceae bacterium]|nr:SDR family NAD(P)-dependent oxidoreductase [Salinisphaeraceae bacterium]
MNKQNSDYNNPVSATLNGILDLFRKKPRIGTLGDDERLDGKTCLVTGANSGLGRATAIELARRGAHVIMACRSGIPEAGQEIKQITGSDKVEMLHLDLSDLASVKASCAELKQRGIVLDRVVLNAGVVPKKPLMTAQGFEMMFGVHFLANVQFLLQMLADGTIPNNRFAQSPNARLQDPPRIVFVSSETHRSGTAIDMDTLGEFVDYGAMGSIAQYGHSKLVMTTWLQELARRLNGPDGLEVAVHCLCPGPINSNIARDAPAAFKPVLGVVMGLLFASPEKACEPVTYLSTAKAIEGQTALYLHLMTQKEPAAQALDTDLAEQVWSASEDFLANAEESMASSNAA